MKNTKDVAKLLANRINQEHYILHYLNEIYYAGVKKGKEQQLNIPVVSVTFVCPNGCDKGCIELSNGYKECRECAYIEQTN